MSEAVILGITIAAASSLAMMGAMMIMAGLNRHRVPPVFVPETEDHDAVFIFQGDTLVDCSDAGRRLLDTLMRQQVDDGGDSLRLRKTRDRREKVALRVLTAYLAGHFQSLDEHLAQLADLGDLRLEAQDDTGLSLTAKLRKGLVQLRLTDTRAEGALIAMDKFSYDALTDELDSLRNVTRTAPVLMWQSDSDGQIVWANTAYIHAICDANDAGGDLGWPLPALFGAAPLGERLSLECKDELRWFSYRNVSAGARLIHFATPIDSTVQSELARREMLQMLTRTFATLPVGLALFDANRRLQVFNPALVDLTGLDPFFLAARPDLGQLLHSLREMRMLPEPKDFNTWRDEMIRMENAAASGTYAEEWHLDNGRIYQVTGSPQPDGALAFFFQDITSEASLMRGYRAEIETAQNILDAVSDAIVAFNPVGQALHANASYVNLWGHDPCIDIDDSGFARAFGKWAEACPAGSYWRELQDYAANSDDTRVLLGSGTLPQGTMVALRAQRLPGGVILITFRRMGQDSTATHRRAMAQAELISMEDHARPVPAEPLHLSRLTSASALPTLASRDAGPRPEPKGRSVRHSGSRLRV